MTAQGTGKEGELLAARYLRKKGFAIVAMNYKTRLGEIDLIAERRGVTVFVEVKTRKNASFSTAAEAVTPAKQQRLRLAAQAWLAEKGECPCRFDVVEVYTQTRQIRHIQNAFS